MSRPLLAAALMLLAASPAFAHARLRAADPAAGSTVAVAPTVLNLTFSEDVEPAFTHVEITDRHGTGESAGALRVDPHDATHVLVPLKPLAAGEYTVTWHAVAVDTHHTHGRFRFTVAP